MKSKENRMLFGVAGGLAEYLDIDPVLVRVAFVASVFFVSIGIVAYILLAIFTRSAPSAPPA